MTLGKRKGTGNRKRRRQLALSGELASELLWTCRKTNSAVLECTKSPTGYRAKSPDILTLTTFYMTCVV